MRAPEIALAVRPAIHNVGGRGPPRGTKGWYFIYDWRFPLRALSAHGGFFFYCFRRNPYCFPLKWGRLCIGSEKSRFNLLPKR